MSGLEYLKDKAQKEQRTIIYTGDLIDFVSELNFEKAEDFCNSVDIFMSSGIMNSAIIWEKQKKTLHTETLVLIGFRKYSETISDTLHE